MVNTLKELNEIPRDFMAISDNWLKTKSYKIKDSTYCKYNYLTKQYINPFFNDLKIYDINSTIINRRMECLYEYYRDRLSYSTLKTVFYLIKAITSYGSAMGYYVKVYFSFEISNKKDEKGIQVLTPIQEKSVIKLALSNYSPNNLGILISLCTGLRLGEVCALSVNDIDFKKRTICINKTVQRLKVPESDTTQLLVSKPKSKKSIRVIPLPDFLYDIFLSYGIESYKNGNYVLTNTNVPYEPRTLQYGFKRVMNKCGLNGFHFHCLRHTFATRCVCSNFDIKMISEMLGHSNVSFTMNIYVHPSLDEKKEKMNILNQTWESMSL